MRTFNKLFVIALPRCATVSLWDALGELGIRVAHLGKIYGEQSPEHHNAERLRQMYEQIVARDFDFDVLRECDGLADYPACIVEVFQGLDRQYPGSLFVNVRRDRDPHGWLQSAERQFVGLQLVKTGRQATPADRAFMETMTEFRRRTFGKVEFDARVFGEAYHRHQQAVAQHFAGRERDLLDVSDLQLLHERGFALLGEFLECPAPNLSFPRRNEHSTAPQEAFLAALARGEIQSQTGITLPDGRPSGGLLTAP
jgi:hypothetical protein